MAPVPGTLKAWQAAMQSKRTIPAVVSRTVLFIGLPEVWRKVIEDSYLNYK
jgi:hypothetical protein